MQRYRTWIELSERALTNNIRSLNSLLDSNARFCAVVKGNAYGHGLKEITQIASRSGVDAFAVDDIDDALTLREYFPSALILVLGYTLFDRFKDALRANILLTLYDKEGIEQAQRIGTELARPFPIHVKIETGTNRQGVLAQDQEDAIRLLLRSPMVSVEGLSTHFANIE